jgi:regulator of protease activity HflC (stomatin/prohibitin superfamily)
VLVLIASLAVGYGLMLVAGSPIPLVAMAIVGVILMQAPRVAQQWERAVVLRLGRFAGLHWPGLFWIVPFVDTISEWIDQRIITTSFAAEQTLTSDTVRSTSTPCCSGWSTMRRRRRSKCRTTSRRSAGRRRPRCATSSAART